MQTGFSVSLPTKIFKTNVTKVVTASSKALPTITSRSKITSVSPAIQSTTIAATKTTNTAPSKIKTAVEIPRGIVHLRNKALIINKTLAPKTIATQGSVGSVPIKFTTIDPKSSTGGIIKQKITSPIKIITKGTSSTNSPKVLLKKLSPTTVHNITKKD